MEFLHATLKLLGDCCIVVGSASSTTLSAPSSSSSSSISSAAAATSALGSSLSTVPLHVSPSSSMGSRQADALMEEVMRLLCHYSSGNSDNQESLRWANSKLPVGLSSSSASQSPLEMLCRDLPFRYYNDAALKDRLFPLLCAACLDNERNATVVNRELSLASLAEFLRERKAGGGSGLGTRFPRERWTSAIEFFEQF